MVCTISARGKTSAGSAALIKLRMDSSVRDKFSRSGVSGCVSLFTTCNNQSMRPRVANSYSSRIGVVTRPANSGRLRQVSDRTSSGPCYVSPAFASNPLGSDLTVYVRAASFFASCHACAFAAGPSPFISDETFEL